MITQQKDPKPSQPKSVQSKSMKSTTSVDESFILSFVNSVRDKPSSKITSPYSSESTEKTPNPSIVIQNPSFDQPLVSLPKEPLPRKNQGLIPSR